MNGLSNYLKLAVSLVLPSLVACFFRPEGGWRPSAARAIDVDGTAAPTVPARAARRSPATSRSATAAGYVASVVHAANRSWLFSTHTP